MPYTQMGIPLLSISAAEDHVRRTGDDTMHGKLVTAAVLGSICIGSLLFASPAAAQWTLY